MLFITSDGTLATQGGYPYILAGKILAPLVRPQPSEVQVDYNFSYTSIPNGAYGTDTLSPDFTNTAGGKSVNGVDPNIDSQFTLKTIASRRDQEVTTWVGKGTVFLRVQNNSAIYFKHNVEGTNGILRIGLLLNTVSTAGEMPSDNMLWESQNLVGLIPGYDRTEGTNLFTYGVEGFDIYVKYNGVEFLRFQEYRYVYSGQVGVKMSSNYGVKTFNVSMLLTKTLFSNPTTKTIDVRDWGWKSGATTGSMSAGSNQLVLNTSPSGVQYKIGDTVIVEIGGEGTFNGRGAGMRGTKGVGGTFPAQSYANLTAMQADTTKANGLYAWREDTGETYSYSTGTSQWTKVSVTITNGDHPFEQDYYVGMAVPIALRAKITNISGLTLTLDKTATVATTNANVYYDNSYILLKLGADTEFDYFYTITPNPNAGEYRDTQNLDNNGWTFNIPAGSYAIGERIDFNDRTTTIMKGAGKTQTTIFSPRGTPSANIYFNGCWDSNIYDFTVSGNAKAQGFGLKWWSWDAGQQNTIVKQIYQFSSTHYPYVMVMQGSGNSDVHNIQINDTFGVAIGTSFSNDVYVYDCNTVMQDSVFFYISWAFQSADSTNVIFERCNFTSPKVQGAFESFKSTGTQFLDCHSTNGKWAFNNAQDPIVTNCSTTMTANSIQPWVHPFEYILNVNTNAATGATGGVINNFVITVQDYQDVNNTILVGYRLGDQNVGVHLVNCSYVAPNYLAPAISAGPQAIRSEGTGMVIDGFNTSATIHMPATQYTANIYIFNGTVRNSNVGTGYIVANTGVTLTNNVGNVIII